MFSFFSVPSLFLLRLFFLAPHHHRCNNGVPAANETCPSNNALMCQSCSRSFSLSSDSTRCEPCKVGKFGAVSSPGVCTNCGAGRYEDSKGSLECKECAKGQSQEEGKGTKCNPCGVGTFANKTSLKQCYDCPQGYYMNDLGSASCFSCSPGKFASFLGSLKCESCPRGYLQDQPKKSFCDKVKAGQVVAKGGSASIQVPLGSKICDEQGDSCETTAPFEACAAGKYGKEPTPTNQCYNCQAGKSSSRGAIKCQACDKGKFNPVTGQTCSECAAGFFQQQNTNPSLSCLACPTGFVQLLPGSSSCSDLGGMKPSDCKDDEYFNASIQISGKPPGDCVSCPLGGSCIGPIDSMGIRPLFGWWKIPTNEQDPTKPTEMFAECLFAPSCLGARNLALVARHSEAKADVMASQTANITCNGQLGFRNVSRLCHTCAADHKREGTNKCAKCPPDQGSNWGLMLLGVLIIFCVLAYIVGDSLSQGVKIYVSASIQKIILNFLQVVTLCGGFPLRWPPALQTLFYVQGSISTLGEHLVNIDCLSTATSAAELYYSKQQMYAALPVLICFISFLFWWSIGRVKKQSFFQKRTNPTDKTYKDKFIVTITSVLYLIYPTLCKNAVSSVAGLIFICILLLFCFFSNF